MHHEQYLPLLDTGQLLGGDGLPVALSPFLQLGEGLHEQPTAKLVGQEWEERVHGFCKLHLQHAPRVLAWVVQESRLQLHGRGCSTRHTLGIMSG